MIVRVDERKPNSDKNWRNHMIVLDSNKAKYSVSVEERENNFAFFDFAWTRWVDMNEHPKLWFSI